MIRGSSPPTGGGRAACCMYTVYALYNSFYKKIYIGQTKDIDSRHSLHNKHFFKNSYTARFEGEWVIIYSEFVEDRKTALKREKQLKSYQGRQFIRLHIPG